MTKYQALQAMMAGKTVRHPATMLVLNLVDGDICRPGGIKIDWRDYHPPFEVHVEPATDKQLIAKFRELADNTHYGLGACQAYRFAAEMLESRKLL